MILIETDSQGPRLDFVCRLIFTEHLGIEYKIVSAATENQPVIYYKNIVEDKALSISPEGLLSETSIRNQKPSVSFLKDLPVLFPQHSDFGFDIFSAVFYMVSRYEEYQPFNPDHHNRFPATESIAFQNNFLNKAVVDHWILELKNKLQIKFPSLQFKYNKFRCEATIDIDNAFAYRGKSGIRAIGSVIRDVVKGNTQQLAERKVFRSGGKDPFDHYDFQLQTSKETDIPLTYFVLCAKKSEYDRSLEPENKELKILVHKLASQTEVGLHPSYFSSEDASQLTKEKNDLSNLAGKEIKKSRQHFLRLRFPDTLSLLESNGITDDYSIGFSTHNGFRAGTSRSFLFFDLVRNQETKLRLHPFQVMDSVFFDQQKKSAEDSFIEIVGLLEEVKSVKGTFTFVWHDRSFDEGRFPGWKKNYQMLHDYCRRATISSQR